MELQDVLTQLVQFVEEAAPAVWAIALKQVVVHAAQGVILIILSAIAIPYLWKFAKRQQELHKEDGYNLHDLGYIFLLIAIVICVVVIVVNALVTIGYLLNPEYYAIKLLLQYAQ